MKILFADASSLQRYSTILVTKQCLKGIMVYETDTLSEMNTVLGRQNITALFIHANMLYKKIDYRLQYSHAINKEIKIILICSNKQELSNFKHIESYIDGTLFLEDSFENTKNHITKMLNIGRDSLKNQHFASYHTLRETMVEPNKQILN